MTDAAPQSPTAADVTPESYIGPLVNLIAAAAPAISTLASSSADVKTIATNFGVANWLPWIATAMTWVGICAACTWVYRRAIGRQHKWALWIAAKMPWNRSA